ncbi:MAG: hypothetical protein KME15_19840 [Drouetiella hepatica Uher 2000/2452]|jgi:hypothetical protein|uniref:Helix-hairpin-helix domain-containing protein n=1 Tax=Drouetiella hepatica Uher 2000/2452 TaxID=904376 RepID=A0A951QGS2_9CYAN|nr:hypothetical protein [Drouetiella hepatica Uher 2000/2452]
MSFVILHTSDGQPWQVPLSEVGRFLALGYRRPEVQPVQPPNEQSSETLSFELPSVPKVSLPTAIVQINRDSLAKLIKLPLVGTAIAKEVIKNRPYQSIEDLIGRVALPAGQSWVALEHLISFEANL